MGEKRRCSEIFLLETVGESCRTPVFRIYVQSKYTLPTSQPPWTTIRFSFQATAVCPPRCAGISPVHSRRHHWFVPAKHDHQWRTVRDLMASKKKSHWRFAGFRPDLQWTCLNLIFREFAFFRSGENRSGAPVNAHQLPSSYQNFSHLCQQDVCLKISLIVYKIAALHWRIHDKKNARRLYPLSGYLCFSSLPFSMEKNLIKRRFIDFSVQYRLQKKGATSWNFRGGWKFQWILRVGPKRGPFLLFSFVYNFWPVDNFSLSSLSLVSLV